MKRIVRVGIIFALGLCADSTIAMKKKESWWSKIFNRKTYQLLGCRLRVWRMERDLSNLEKAFARANKIEDFTSPYDNTPLFKSLEECKGREEKLKVERKDFVECTTTNFLYRQRIRELAEDEKKDIEAITSEKMTPIDNDMIKLCKSMNEKLRNRVESEEKRSRVAMSQLTLQAIEKRKEREKIQKEGTLEQRREKEEKERKEYLESEKLQEMMREKRKKAEEECFERMKHVKEENSLKIKKYIEKSQKKENDLKDLSALWMPNFEGKVSISQRRGFQKIMFEQNNKINNMLDACEEYISDVQKKNEELDKLLNPLHSDTV